MRSEWRSVAIEGGGASLEPPCRRLPPPRRTWAEGFRTSRNECVLRFRTTAARGRHLPDRYTGCQPKDAGSDAPAESARVPEEWKPRHPVRNLGEHQVQSARRGLASVLSATGGTAFTTSITGGSQPWPEILVNSDYDGYLASLTEEIVDVAMATGLPESRRFRWAVAYIQAANQAGRRRYF